MNLVLAFDLGTTHIKWIVLDPESGQRIWSGQSVAGTTTDGLRSEQDPDLIWNQVKMVMTEVHQYGRLTRISFSAAMHSFLVVDPDGRPMTASWTWMDKRGQATAKSLRCSELGMLLRQNSGVPIHPMSPLVKWLYIRSHFPSCRPVALKDYLVFRLTDQWATDYSTAATSGFLGVDGTWLPEALEISALKPEEMPTLYDMAWSLPLADERAEVVLGGNDGATSHIHLRIPPDGRQAVLAMGTSGALRTTLKNPAYSDELFSYTMGPERGHLVGSAFSNVGNVLAWLSGVFKLTIDEVISDGITAIRHQKPLPLALPYWFGERSPWWREDLAGAWLGVEPRHGRSELIGSVLLSVSASFWHGLSTLDNLESRISELRGGSGLLENPVLAQWMADVLGRRLVLQDTGDASLWGALDLAGHYPLARDSSGPHFDPRDSSIQTRVKDAWHQIHDAMQNPLR